MKRLLPLFFLVPSFSWAADERARKDINNVPSQLGIAETSGELRNLKVTNEGWVLSRSTGTTSISGVISANQGAAGLQEWLVKISSVSAIKITSMETAGKTYTYKSSALTAPGTTTLTGIGYSWLVRSSGGNATFNISGGDSITVGPGLWIGSEFREKVTNPSVNLTALDSGATAYVLIDGAN